LTPTTGFSFDVAFFTKYQTSLAAFELYLFLRRTASKVVKAGCRALGSVAAVNGRMGPVPTTGPGAHTVEDAGLTFSALRNRFALGPSTVRFAWRAVRFRGAELMPLGAAEL